MLWNVFYEDSSLAIRSQSFEEIVFADDLNAFRKYNAGTPNETILADMNSCQAELHSWGKANQVVFDASKESQHILLRSNPYGDPFVLFGVQFDCKLLMTDGVRELATTCRWKLRSVLRTRKFNNGLQLVQLYKAQLLSYIEYRTAAIYHACQSSLDELDSIQNKLLEAAGMTSVDALNACRLAPLSARGDIALLGLIHRTVLGKGPGHFAAFFRADLEARQNGRGKHRLQLVEYANGHASDYTFPGSRPANYIAHSMFGLVAVYNRLPAYIVEGCGSVSSFQAALQQVLGAWANAGVWNWERTFSPRVPWHRHLLTKGL